MKAFHVIDSHKTLYLVTADSKDIAREIVNAKRSYAYAYVFFDAVECRHGKYLPPVCDEWMEYSVHEESQLCKVCCSYHVIGKLTHVFVRSPKEIRMMENEIDL